MNTEELIKSLSADLKPVKRSRPASILFIAWTVISSVIFLAVLAFIRHTPVLRADEAAVIFLQLIGGLAAASTAVMFGFPEKNMRYWGATLIPAIALFVYLIIRVFLAPSFQLTGFKCALLVLLMAGPSALTLHFMIRDLFPARRMETRFLVFFGAGLFASAFLTGACAIDTPEHNLIFHSAPALLFAGAGIFALRRWDSTEHSKTGADQSD